MSTLILHLITLLRIGIVGAIAKEPTKSVVVVKGDTTMVEKPNYYEQLRQQMIIDGNKTGGRDDDAVDAEEAVISSSVDGQGSDDEYEEDDDDYDFDYDVDDDYGDYETPSAGTMSESLMIALGLDVTSRPKVESDWVPPTVSGLEHSARKFSLYPFIRNTSLLTLHPSISFHLSSHSDHKNEIQLL